MGVCGTVGQTAFGRQDKLSKGVHVKLKKYKYKLLKIIANVTQMPQWKTKYSARHGLLGLLLPGILLEIETSAITF